MLYFLGTGLISVQILGEQKPFISYIDPHPIKVNYVTFYSVDPFIIKFNCPAMLETNYTELPTSVEKTGKIDIQREVQDCN